MRLSELLSSLPPAALQGWLVPPPESDPEISRVTADSRQVIPGALFVACPGDAFDGRDFILDALARGAAAIVTQADSAASFPAQPNPPSSLQPPTSDLQPPASDLYIPQSNARVPQLLAPDSRFALGWLSAAFHGHPSRSLVLVGVTGTDGKTTTASLIHAILQAAGLRAGLISTVSAVIGGQELDTGFHVTTPDAPEIQEYLGRMLRAGLTHAVLEVTSHGLAQQRVAGCHFDVAVVTNVTHEHLDYHKTYEDYLAAKGRLFEMLDAGFPKPGLPPAGVVNRDDASADYLAGRTGARVIGYGLRPGAEVTAREIAFRPDGISFRAVGPGFDIPLRSPLVGAYNVSNCLAAVSAALGALGLPPEAAQQGIAGLAGIPGRMERIGLGQPFTALVDFAHTPNALRRALETARQMSAGRVIAVFGSAGLRDVEKRRLMAETSAQLADLTVLTAEDPRTESLDDILEMMAGAARARGGVEGQSFFRVPDRGDALRLAVHLARPGDILLAFGKGHEQTMCFGTVEHPWDDRTALRAALAELLGLPGPSMPWLPTSGNY